MTLPVEILLREVEKRGTQAAVARWLGVSRAYVSDMIAGNRQPGPKILKRLGLKREIQRQTQTIYRRAS